MQNWGKNQQQSCVGSDHMPSWMVLTVWGHSLEGKRMVGLFYVCQMKKVWKAMLCTIYFSCLFLILKNKLVHDSIKRYPCKSKDLEIDIYLFLLPWAFDKSFSFLIY